MLLSERSATRKRHKKRRPADLIQLGACGEGYVTTLRGATLLLEAYQKHGILGCPDQQLNDPRWHKRAGIKSVRAARETPWVLIVPTNFGDISRTTCISSADHEQLRFATSSMGRLQQLRVNRTAVQLHAVQQNRKRGYCRSFDRVYINRTGQRTFRYKPAADYLS